MSTDQVEQVKQKVDIVEVIGERVALKKAGRHFKGLCPFHSEKSPSFIVSPERQSFKCFGCFPEGSLIKTNGGLMPIEKIRQGDEIISGNGALRRVTRLLIRDYEGGLRHIKIRKLSGEVVLTQDHQIYVVRGAPYTRQYKNFSKRYRKYLTYEEDKYFRLTEEYFPIKKLSSGELRTGDMLLYPIVQTVIDYQMIDLQKYAGVNKRGIKPRQFPLKVDLNEDFLKLLGYYIAEGSNHRAYIRFSLGNNEEDFAQEIVLLIKRIFGLEASIYRRSGDSSKTGLEVTCCNSQLARIFENLCGKGAENKHIPYELNLLPPAKQRVLLEAIWKGDGTDFVRSKTTNVARSITTISRELTIQIRDILLRNEIFPSENKLLARISKDGVHHRNSYTTYWSEKVKSKYSLIYKSRTGEAYWLLPISNISESEYNDKVYNLTVDVDHSYMSENFAVGNCQEGGDVFSFLEKYDGMSFLEALESLAKRAGITLESYRPTSQDSRKKKLLQAMDLASEYYHFLLTKHESGQEAREYLKHRGISNESIEQFKLGWAPKSWRSVSDYLVKKKGYQDQDLEEIGMVIRSDGGRYYDRFRGRVMFPLRDHRGLTVGFSGRTLSTEATEAKYINSPETFLYSKSRMLYGLWENREYIRKEDKIVLVEGELDVIPSVQAGVKSAVAIKGSAFTEEQARLITRYTKNIYMALDADSAGQEAIKRAVNIAETLDMSIRVVQITGGKDPGEVASESAKSWREMVKVGVLYWDFLIDSATSKNDPTTGTGARVISQEVVPAIAGIANLVVRAHYVSALAKKLKVPEESVYEEIERVRKKKELFGLKETVKKIEKGETQNRRSVLEEYLLAIGLQHYKTIKEKLPAVEEKWFATRSVGRILAELKKWSGKELDIKAFAGTLPDELQEMIDKAYLRDLMGIEQVEKEWETTINDIQEMFIKARLTELTGEIAGSEKKEGEEKKLEAMQEEFADLSRKLSQIPK